VSSRLREGRRSIQLIVPVESKPELGKYELREEIGHGGMATVYLARDRRLGRDVAVKIIHRHLRENAEVAARFASEARAVAKLKHPNIVEVYDVSDEAEAERYLVVELVRGTTLRALVSEHGQLPAEIAAIIAFEVANALDHAHQLGVIHRDVKPENVLIAIPSGPASDVRASNPDETLVKITDFGIAKLLDAQGVTSTGQVLGSPAHMAPEQIEGGDVNARADVFGLGVMLYETMVGRLPFDGKNPAQVLRRVLDGAFTPAEKARPTIGAQFSAIVGRALAHEPSARYASAEEFAAALKQELDALGYVDLRSELRAFFADPKAYREAYEPRTVERLVKRANDARAAGAIPLSAACLNRALALRPDDPTLIAEVTNLGRAERMRRNLKSALVALGASALLAGLAFSVSRLGGRLVTPRAPASAPQNLAKTLASSVSPPRPPASVAALSSAPVPPPRRGGLRAPPPRPAPSAVADRVPVRITVDGPQSATVRVDGVELEDWFSPQQLEVGTHSFEFLPPNTECCDQGQTVTVEIVPQETPGKIQTVRGRIGFKDAMLEIDGTLGARASCPALGGTFPVPSRQTFPMGSASRSVKCTLIPPPGSGLLPKEFDVTLSPGRVSSIPGP
jgi:eukaryotic-like serine/threonine-protein kinase